MIWTDLAFGPCYLGLNLHVIGLESRQKWIWASIQIFFLVGPQIGPKFGAHRADLGPT